MIQFKILIRCICALFIVIPASAQQYPNIIYILADDLGYGDLSCLNESSKLQTINIDAIAKQGMIFTDAHSSSAVCSPTRYGILTGRYNWRTHLQSGVLWSYDTMLITRERTTVASLLKKGGYHTACIGKWHLGLNWQKDATGKAGITQPITFGPNNIGFDYFYGITASLDIPPYVYIQNDKITATTLYSIDGTTGKGFWRSGPVGNDFKHEEVLPHLTEKAVEYIKTEAANDQPFFLYFPLTAPHTPILPAKEYRGKSGTNEYGDFVLMVDDMVGKVLRAVREAGIEENTIIVFTSDNGVTPASDFEEMHAAGHYSSYVFRGAKSDIYEGGHHIPFIVKWPGKVTPGSKTAATVCLTDFLATAAAITGRKLKDNEGEDSYNLLPLLLQKGKYERTHIIHHSIDGNFSIREGKWKLEFAYGSGGWSAPTEKKGKEENLPHVQLYDLDTDIAEQTNVARLHPDVVSRLSAEIKTIIENGRSTPGNKQANDVKVDYLKQ